MTTQTSIYEYALQGVELSANKVALWFYGRAIQYRELFRKIDNVADHLYTLGVRQGTVVTIHLPNCPQAVMAIYAVAKLGGICNMVHPLTPLKALRENMLFTESRLLITGDHFEDCEAVDFADHLLYVSMAAHMGLVYNIGYRIKVRRALPENGISFENLEKPAKVFAQYPKQEELAEQCVAYLNSSGTTGMPKTVMQSHTACNNWVENAKAFFREKSLENEVVLSVLPFFHGSGLVMDLHQVMCAGGTQLLFAKWNAKQAVREIRRRKATVLTGVPYLYQSLLEQKRFCGDVARRITQCYVSGDNTPPELKHALDSRVGHRVLFEGYGMTETVTACFSTSIYNDRLDASGYPLVNCYAAVIDRRGNLIYHGAGELVVSTNTMMLGYLKDPEATTQAFFCHDGRQWFRTGDYGVIDDEGYLYFRERLKNIIIRNGYNIYPGEIEAVIRQQDFVVDTAVVGKKKADAKGEDICALVVIAGHMNMEYARAKILESCAAALPRFSVPNRIVFVEKIHRNRMAKVDKEKLVNLL